MSHQTLPQADKSSSKLDRAIVASVAVMTIFVLAQQLHPAPSFAASDVRVAQLA